MPYCPQCLIEYVEGTAKCEDCNADLLPGSPPEARPVPDLRAEKDIKLVTVHVFSGGTAQMDADLARNILQSQGIPSLLQGETSAELLPVLDIPLLVREGDAAQAERILKDFLEAEVQTTVEDADSAQGE